MHFLTPVLSGPARVLFTTLLLAAVLFLPWSASAQTASLTDLHDFSGPPNGVAPQGGVVQGGDGNFYGTTEYGGANGYGVVFRMTPDGAATTLYSFQNLSDGAYPQTPLIKGNDGNFYGTTSGDLTNPAQKSCTVFQITPTGVFNTLHDFHFTPDLADTYDIPTALVQGSDGNLYGTTHGLIFGASNPNYGCFFQITSAGTFKILL